METWKPIKEYEGLYEVNNFGNIKSLRSGKILSERKAVNKWGYVTHSVNLCKNGVAKTKVIARLVAQAFLDNPHGKSQVNHKDFNPSNNHVSNLEWVTPLENIRYSYERGRYSNTRFHKLKEERLKMEKEWAIISRRFLKGEINFIS